MKKLPWISWSWSEGRIWDHWMFVHFISGTIIACCVTLLEMRDLHAYLMVLGLMVSWEIGEMVGGVREEPENWLLDVAVGMLGFFIFETYVLPSLGREIIWCLLSVLTVLGALAALSGWRAFRRRRKK